MIVYADSDFYINEYLLGKKAVIDTASFAFYARKATQFIKKYTFDNVPETVPEVVKMCCCEVAELIYNSEKSNISQGIASESVGDLSVSYESSENHTKLLAENIKSVIYSWLTGTGLLYRGVR
jgi:hypothetical protein